MVIFGIILILVGVGWAFLSKSLFDDYNELNRKDPTNAHKNASDLNTQRRDFFIGIGVAIMGAIVTALGIF